MKYILKEITQLEPQELFVANYYPNSQMDYPLHFHEYYELCLTLNVRGKRITGNLVENFTEKDLVITMPNVLHCYKRDEKFNEVRCEAVVVKFSKDLCESELFNTKQLKSIKDMLTANAPGLSFSQETIDAERDKILKLTSLTTGFAGVTLFLEILNDLAVSAPATISLNDNTEQGIVTYSRRINKIIQYVETNYRNKISLEEVGAQVNMSASSVSRFFKKRTRHKFWDYLNNFRIDKAALMMAETEHTISEICYDCGFNNISNFNRVFRSRVGQTPSEYRKRYKASMIRKEE